MSNLITLLPIDSFDFDDVLFEFDTPQMQSRQISINVTQDPTEAGFIISNAAILMPIIFSASGYVSAWTLSEETPERLANVSDVLHSLITARSLVSYSSNLWSFDVIIVSCKEQESAEEGKILKVDLTFQTVTQSERRFVELPPELVTPSKAKTVLSENAQRISAAALAGGTGAAEVLSDNEANVWLADVQEGMESGQESVLGGTVE